MTKFGIFVTVAYAALIIALRFDSIHTLRSMPLNEFGDFFAGVFGLSLIYFGIKAKIDTFKH